MSDLVECWDTCWHYPLSWSFIMACSRVAVGGGRRFFGAKNFRFGGRPPSFFLHETLMNDCDWDVPSLLYLKLFSESWHRKRRKAIPRLKRKESVNRVRRNESVSTCSKEQVNVRQRPRPKRSSANNSLHNRSNWSSIGSLRRTPKAWDQISCACLISLECDWHHLSPYWSYL